MRQLAAVAAAFFVRPTVLQPSGQADARVVLPLPGPVQIAAPHVPRASARAGRSSSSLERTCAAAAGAAALAAALSATSYRGTFVGARPRRRLALAALQGRAAERTVEFGESAAAEEKALKPDVRVLRLARKRRFVDAEAVHVGLVAKGQALDSGTARAFLREAVAQGQVELALRAFKRHRGKSRELYTDFIAALAAKKVRGRRLDPVVQRRRCATAVALLRELQGSGLGVDAVALGAGVCALIGANRHGDAKRILLRAKRSGIPVSTNVYNVYLRELSESRDVEGIQRKLRRMAARGVASNEVTHATVVHAYVKVKRFDLAEAALEAAGASAGVEAYGALIGGYSRMRRFDFARGVLQQMASEGVPPNAIVYHDMMHRLVLDGRLKEALQVTRDMKKVGLEFELPHYNTLLLGLGRGGHFAKAFELLREMHEKGMPPTVTSYNVLLDTAVRNSEARALEVVRAMRDDGLTPDVATFTTLVKSLGAGDASRVRGLLRQAESVGVQPDRVMYNAFVTAFARGGAFGEAEALVEQMSSDRATRPDKITFAALGFAYFSAGKPVAALEVYARATESGAPLDAYFFNGFVENLVHARFYDDAVRVAETAEKRGITVDRSKFSELFALRNEEEGSALERFKFWLGIPNHCYNEDWRASKEPPRSSGPASTFTPELSASFMSPITGPLFGI